MTRLVIDETSVYEIDEECLREKERERQEKEEKERPKKKLEQKT